MLVVASMVFVFSSCSEDEDKNSKFNYPMETLYGTWEATHIKFFVGQSVNVAHQGLPIDITMKLKLVEKLAENMRAMGKTVILNYD